MDMGIPRSNSRSLDLLPALENARAGFFMVIFWVLLNMNVGFCSLLETSRGRNHGMIFEKNDGCPPCFQQFNVIQCIAAGTGPSFPNQKQLPREWFWGICFIMMLNQILLKLMRLITMEQNRQSIQPCFCWFYHSMGMGTGPSKQDHVKTWESKVYIASIGPCESYHRRFVIGGHHKGFLVMHDGYQTKLPEFQETYMAYKKLWLILNDFIRL